MEDELHDRLMFGALAATCTAPVSDEKHFDISIVDEAGQATEPAVIGLVWRSDHVVLCGDVQQLPGHGQTEVMIRSLMQRLGHRPGMNIQLLDCQYRMPPDLMRFPNTYFYQDKVHSHQSSLRPQQLVAGFSWRESRPAAWVHVRGRENRIGTSWKMSKKLKQCKTLSPDCFVFETIVQRI